MKRAVISVCAALALVATLTSPGHATVTKRLKQESGSGCGPDNYTRTDSWVALDDRNTGTNSDDKIDYDANGPDAIGDLRVNLWNQGDVQSIAIEIRKLNNDGPGYVVHHEMGKSYISASSSEDFEFASVSRINRDRHPYLWVRVVWDGGACNTKTAYFDNWVP